PHNNTLRDALLREGDSVLTFVLRRLDVSQTVPALIAAAMTNLLILALLAFTLGQRFIRWLVAAVRQTGSDELFTVMIIAASLLAAFGTKAIFGLSLALGALFAGIIIGQTESHHRVGEEVRPFRDVFGVLFFAAVGMLFDPRTLLWLPGQVLAVLGII